MRPAKALERPPCRTGSSPLNDAAWSRVMRPAKALERPPLLEGPRQHRPADRVAEHVEPDEGRRGALVGLDALDVEGMDSEHVAMRTVTRGGPAPM